MKQIFAGIIVFTFASQGFAAGDNQRSDTAVTLDEVDQHRTDMNKALTEARAIPHSENGKPAGFRMVQPCNGSKYERLGLKNGDVITGVNGQAVNDPQKASQILNKAKSGDSLQVIRDGSAETMKS